MVCQFLAVGTQESPRIGILVFSLAKANHPSLHPPLWWCCCWGGGGAKTGTSGRRALHVACLECGIGNCRKSGKQQISLTGSVQ